MFDKKIGNGDYRMMMCAQVNDEDLITIHHEIGHIMYFMAYSKLPTVFQVCRQIGSYYGAFALFSTLVTGEIRILFYLFTGRC